MAFLWRALVGAIVGVGLGCVFAKGWLGVALSAFTSSLIALLPRLLLRLPRKVPQVLKLVPLVAAFAFLASPIALAALHNWGIEPPELHCPYWLPILLGLLGGGIVFLCDAGVKARSAARVKPGERAKPAAIGGSVLGALVLMFWDCVNGGTYITSIIVCPVWLATSVVKNTIQRPGWRTALLRIAAPALTLGIVLANDAFQRDIAERNAKRIIKACDDFHAANHRYPRTLDELVPRYLNCVPRAKYCLTWGEFRYWNLGNDEPFMDWCVVPPFGRKIYNFKERRWGYLD
jgi:MFS family permease